MTSNHADGDAVRLALGSRTGPGTHRGRPNQRPQLGGAAPAAGRAGETHRARPPSADAGDDGAAGGVPQVPVGHRLQLVIAAPTRRTRIRPRQRRYTVALTGDRAAAIPVLATTALNANTLDVPLPLVIVVAVLAAALSDSCVLSWRRRPRRSRQC